MLRVASRILPIIACIVLGVVTARAQTSAHLRTVDLPSYAVPAGSDARLFVYTNRESAFYYGTLNGENGSGFHGITRAQRKLFENYWILLGDSLLDRRAAEVHVTPAGFVRRYARYNTVEHVSFADSLTLLSVSLKTDFRGELRVYPGWSLSWQRATEAVGRGMYMLRDSVLTAAACVQGVDGSWEVAQRRDVQQLPNPGPVHVPACYIGESTGRLHLTIECADAGSTLEARPPQELFRIVKRKELAITAHLASLNFSCSDSSTTQAFNWIASSMRALVMNQHGKGIYAGLPWFDNYWGRDSFIAFPGALLVTGQFETAREVLRSFLRHMDRDSSSATYGRVPNRVQPGEIIYNSVDGTPRLVIQAAEYVRVSGDTVFAGEIHKDVVRSVEGALRHTDRFGFLTHADADTWMDAVGPEGPWSPRGNRAADIQALWHGQLEAAASIATLSGDTLRAKRWRAFARQLARAFREEFVDTTRSRMPAPAEQRMPLRSAPRHAATLHTTLTIADHLNVDGSADYARRPNTLFVLTEGALMRAVDSMRVQRFAAELLSGLAYPWGIASLSQDDVSFHPWHQASRFYPKDAAYHNGTVWTWLSGPAVEIMTRYGAADSAWVLTRALQHYAMETGAIGCIPENTDALPRDGASLPRWSGTFSQAWSAAEYLRNMYRHYLGATPGTAEGQPVLTLTPALPAALDFIAATVRSGDSRVHVRCDRSAEGNLQYTLTHLSGNDSVLVRIAPEPDGALAPGQKKTFLASTDTAGAIFRDTFQFAVPRSPAGIASIAPSPWPRIPGSVATASRDRARELCASSDPAMDDTGPGGTFLYPRSAMFRPGSFDLRHFSVAADEENVFFHIRMRALSQPGWHPEYGFQLTMLAIAIDQSHRASEQSRAIGHNSGYLLPDDRGYDRLILVGGGVQVRDAEGNIVTEFLPEHEEDAFGDLTSSTISFAIPRAYLGGAFDHWRYTVVAGAQDDHGGAGIGEFRAVRTEAGEWVGGGAAVEGVNWYDDMTCP
ncbi:MAG: amylo-alpha-1,6-glucosidase [Bacteroidota bacterium]|nr:amylo-alpha-1,6-glucosidase [Bacteroidota bacterium]